MGTFAANSIPAPLMRQVMEGLKKRNAQSFASRVCRMVPVDAISGSVVVEPSIISLPTAEDEGVAEGTVVTRAGGSLDELVYKTKVFKKTAEIPLGAEIQANAVGYNMLMRRMQFCEDVSNMKLDKHFATVLASTTLNNTWSVTSNGNGQWSDGGVSSTPFDDIRTVIRLVPGADTMILGEAVANELASHPDFIAESSNFAAGTVSTSEVADILVRKIKDLKRVFIFDAYYNGAAHGEALSLTRLFDKSVWIGYGTELPCMNLTTENPRAINEFDGEAECRIVGFSQRKVIKRPHKELGYTLASVVA